MKKIKYFVYTILVAVLALCVLPSLQNNVEVSAQGEPEYFSVIQYSGTSQIATIEDNGVAYVNNSNTVVAKLQNDNIRTISPSITFNGVAYENDVLKTEYGIIVDYQEKIFTLTSTFSGKNQPYGKYELNVSYTIMENYIEVTRSFNYTYYVVAESSYYNSNAVNTTFDNTKQLSQSSILYDRIFQYNYQDDLPTLTFNKNNFYVTISKSFQSTIQRENIYFDGTKINSDNNLVYIKEDADTNYVTLTFNDLGAYTISYQLMYTYGTHTNFIAPSTTKTSRLCDYLEVFGYQAYYSDVQTSQIKEFKTLNNGVIGDEFTDISTYSNEDGNSLDNKESSTLETILSLINANTLKIQKTNQTPVQFKYNVQIFNKDNSEMSDTQSGYWLLTENDGVYKLGEKQNFDNKPFTESGKYLVKVVYKFYSAILAADENYSPSKINETQTEMLRSQWFLFEITRDAAQMSIVNKTDNSAIADGTYTNQDVVISKKENTSIFNANTQLVVFLQRDYVGEYETVATVSANEQYTATQNGKYIVTMYFGKNLARSYSSTFTIDKNEIDNVQMFATSKLEYSEYYQRNNQIDFWTNTPVVVSWNEKASGSQTKAEYKYIPLVKDDTKLNDDTLNQYYSNKAIPVSYYFDYQNDVLSSILYTNAQSYTYIPSACVLSQPGMYIFKISDSAGNEKYTSFIIDTTQAKILQKVNNTFVEPSQLNILSNDTTILWGQYKVIKFNNITHYNNGFSVNDPWLKNVLETTNIFNKYFVSMSINTANIIFTRSEISSDVLININGVYQFITSSSENNFGYEIKANQENDYQFYIRDSVNTKYVPGYNVVSVQNYVTNYSGTHRVTISTDASISQLVYTKNGNLTNLYQDSFAPESTTEEENSQQLTKKAKYFIPTTIDTLKDCGETLQFIFKPVCEQGVIEIDSITYTYSEFNPRHISDETGFAYTYSFNQSSDEITVYSKQNPSQNKAFTMLEEGVYVWDVNKEYNSLTASYQTKAGKYTITRKYAVLSETLTKVSGTADYMIRTLTFIVDRNGIISSPIVVSENPTTMYNYVGESIKLQVLENTNKMFFNEVYIASNNTTSNTPILETNKLPVFVYIPVVKYGYSLTDGGTFRYEDSANYYDASKKDESQITSYMLSAEIKYSFEASTLDQSSTIFISSEGSNGYLKFYDQEESSGIAFTNVGYYKVTIRQGFSAYGQNTFSFIFRITEEEPSFTVLNPNTNEELLASNGNYYTNQDIVRLSWTDSSNKFMSVINKEAITYQVNANEIITIDPNQIQTTGLNHYVDLNLRDIGGYAHGCEINITMQFEGKQEDYNEGKFQTSRKIVIDTIAPTTNINRLVGLTGIDQTLLRNVQLKYNTSVANGIYKYFAFPVDVSNLTNLIDINSYSNGEAYTILYRLFEKVTTTGEVVQTKYHDNETQETSVTQIENSTSNFIRLDEFSLYELLNNPNNLNKYIEIVEMDLAGNITIYTIYLTSINALAETNQTPIEYLNNDEKQVLTYSELNNIINIYAKSTLQITNLNMMGFDWTTVTINGKTYLKTPYSQSKYYDLLEYDAANPDTSAYTLSEIGLLTPSSVIQNIQIGLVPYYNTINLSATVLNTSLSVIHTSATNLYADQEGILVKIPSSSSTNDALIYATSIKITQYLKNLDGSYNEDVMYNVESDTYFKESNQQLTNTNFIVTTYVNYLGSTYMKIIVNNPVENRFYRYNIIDNFKDIYPITNIYGSEQIDVEMYSDVDIVEHYENGQLFYYSTKEIRFKYNSAKDNIILTTTNAYTTRKFDLSNPSQIELFNNSGFGKILIPVGNSVVYTIVMYESNQDMSEGLIGGEIKFVLEIYEAIVNINSGLPYRTLNFITYNIIPAINLIGTLSDNQNNLFNKGSMYTDELQITYRQTTGRIDCLVYLMYEDGTVEQIISGKIVSDPQTYTIIIKYITLFDDPQYDIYLDFTISDNDEDFYQVVYNSNGKYEFAKPTGNEFTFKDGENTRHIEVHYILNTSDFQIRYNSGQGMKESTPLTYVINNYTTYIYTLTNVGSDIPVSNYFTKIIAITVIPQSNNILSNFSHYTSEGTRINMTGTLASFVVSTEENTSTNKRIAWKSFYGIEQNLVTVEVYFGDNQTVYTPNLVTENGMTSMTLSASGTYYLTFKDLAGNVNMFDSSNSTYTIRYLKSVIYYVNDQAPINNAVYDDEVKITVPNSTLRYYDTNAQPRLYATLNGEEYSPKLDSITRTYTFNKAGLYKVWFTAAVTISGNVTNINQSPLYFLILNKNETRYAFDFSEYADYYVERVLKNNEDITSFITNENMGKLTYKTLTDENGVSYEKPYLKNFLISMYDAQTGVGRYTVTINTDNEFGQKFTFEFWINNTTPSIHVSHEQNTATTDPITVSFNTADILEDIGDCVLKISGRDDLNLNHQALSDGKLQQSYEITLSAARTYFIQLYSESGKLIYSYRVVKNEPLNTVSIITIVVSVVVVVGLVVVFILLRKKMKIR